MSRAVRQEIPILDLRGEIEEHWAELMEAVQDVLRSGRFILGPNVGAFEDELASYLGVRHAIGVNSGTDALVIGLRALGIGPGDEVVTSPFTFFATPESITNVGATPVFVDIDPVTFNLDPALIEPAITDRTRAIVPVHLFGQACDMDPIMDVARRHGLKVIEDVAQALGGAYRETKLARFGDSAALSFFPSKNLGGFGDGGMVVTNDDDVADRARMLRAHGSRVKYANEFAGYNSRLDELQAAMLRVKLRHLDERNRQRRSVAARYEDALRGVDGVVTPREAVDTLHVFHQYTVRVPGRRSAVQSELATGGVGTMVYFPTPCHRLPAYEGPPIHLPESERAATDVLSLPMGPLLGPDDQDQVTSLLRAALGE